MLVLEHERLAPVAVKHLRGNLAGQGLMVEKRDIGRIAVGCGATGVLREVERMRDDVANHQFGHFVLLAQRQLAQAGGHGGRFRLFHAG